MMEVSDEILADGVSAANEAFGCGSCATDMGDARRAVSSPSIGTSLYMQRASPWSVFIHAYVKAAMKYSGKAP